MSEINSEIIDIIFRISKQYNENINNRYLRSALNNLKIDRSYLDLIESIGAVEQEDGLSNISLMGLYDRIYALANYVSAIRKQLLPNLRFIVSNSSSVLTRPGSFSGDAKIMQDIAISNFTSNLSIFADLVNELYLETVEYDKSINKDRAVYLKLSFLNEIGPLLVN